jgi:hypothetical protein
MISVWINDESIMAGGSVMFGIRINRLDISLYNDVEIVF